MIGPLHHRVAGRSVEELILDEIDGATSERERGQLSEHVRTCLTCQATASAHRRLKQRIEGRIPDRAEIERARLESRRRIAAAQVTATGPRPLAALFPVFGAAAAVLLVLAALFVGTRVASPSYPDREVVAERTVEVPGGTARLVVEQGSRFARPGSAIGVQVRADITLSQGSEGSVELRIATSGPGYGTIARAPDVSGARRIAIEGAIPDVERGKTEPVEVWLHFVAVSVDSEHVRIELTSAVGGGTRAVAR